MLRIGGESLSHSSQNSFQAICKLLLWSRLSCATMSFYTHPSDRAVTQSHPEDKSNTTQNVLDAEAPSMDWRKTNTNWKSQFVKKLKIRKHIPIIRLPREKGYTQESHSDDGTPGIIIHPFHQALVINGTSASRHDSEGLRSPVNPSSTVPRSRDVLQSRAALLRIISKTQCVSEAWEAYNTLLSTHKPRISVSHNAPGSMSPKRSGEVTIPYPHLHRLARLLSSTRPRTRQLFLRLLSVLTILRSTGGPIFLWEWNALIDCAGKGWRKTNIEDYRTALGIFQDMVTSNRIASSSSEPRHASSEWKDMLPADRHPIEQPDIITFTTLLDIASRTLDDKAILHAMSLLAASGLPWNNVTLMARLPYFIHTNQLHAVRGILSVIVTRGLDLSTVNGCLWAYAYRGRLRMVMEVYSLLRRNIPVEDRLDLGDSNRPPLSMDPESYNEVKGENGNHFLSIPGFISQATMEPDVVTYTLIIQALCYHGDLIAALTVFRDMVSTVDPRLRRSGKRGGNIQLAYYKPTYAIYRAIFLAFARHANKAAPTLARTLMSKQQGIDTVPLKEFAVRLTPSPSMPGIRCPSPQELATETPWTLENLDNIFARFLEMDWEYENNGADISGHTRPSDRMVYWIMVAYAKTTKGNIRRMYEVWQKLEVRFGHKYANENLEKRLSRFAKDLEERRHQTDGDNCP